MVAIITQSRNKAGVRQPRGAGRAETKALRHPQLWTEGSKHLGDKDHPQAWMVAILARCRSKAGAEQPSGAARAKTKALRHPQLWTTRTSARRRDSVAIGPHITIAGINKFLALWMSVFVTTGAKTNGV